MSLDPGVLLGPYRIETLVGRGGMGEVYRARDTRLGRAVALKVLPAAAVGDRETGERFDREARTIASLSHPHICALFDVGISGATRYLVMEYLDGETLADRLRAGPMPVEQVLPIAAQIAAALAAAHERRIIHRDLKPANVKLGPTGAKVLDFGLAKVLDSGSAAGAEPATELPTLPYTILGTAPYMSPEQARGAPLDQRTDCWSFGVVLWEMLTGKALFAAGSTAESLAGVLRAEIDFRSLPAGTPAEVRQLLARLLERDPGRRLADIATAALLLASLAAPGPAAPAASHSIVVLPFVNSSPDPENEYFSDGLTEEVIADLSKVGALRVISRTTAMRLKGTGKDLATVARELDVRYALEGSVRKAGDALRITAQLVDTRNDATLWSDKYSGTLEDVFAIQERVSRAIVAALRVHLDDSEDRGLAAPSKPNAYAYDTWLRARRDIWSFVPERMRRAEAELEHALAAVGDDPLLHNGLGLLHWQYLNAGIHTDERHLEAARRHARKVAELSPRSALGPRLLGLIAAQEGDLRMWVRNLKRAVDIDPHDPDQAVWLALAWTFAGFPQHARPLLARIRSTDPHFDYLHFGLGLDAYFDGDFTAAEAHLERGRALSPDHPGVPMVLAQVIGSAGDLERMARVVDESAPDPRSHPLATLAHVLKNALQGHAEAADALATEDWAARMWRDCQYAHAMAQAQAALGRTDAALRWLGSATGHGLIHYPFLAERDPLLARLRDDPRCAALLEKVRQRWGGFEASVEAA
jgi:TolB-like protein/Flp pilus assembly protein TadD